MNSVDKGILKKIPDIGYDGRPICVNHLLLGYISERRSITKRLRLKQLIKEIETYNQISGNEIDLILIKSSEENTISLTNVNHFFWHCTNSVCSWHTPSSVLL